MALALSWGLAFATLITLIVIPAALAVSLETGTHFKRWRENVSQKFSKNK
jgi:hypothetical protein